MSWLTTDLPAIDGAYKLCPEDFFVEELPLYPCSGQGEHLYLQIEKRGLTTPEILRQIAACLNLPEREIGYAGLKDAQAVTRQWLSLPASCEKALSALAQLPVKVLTCDRHGNKLRLGHLLGNRFRIMIRNSGPTAKQRADNILKQLVEHGVPNIFGEQRYGLLGNSHQLGHLLLTKNYSGFCREVIGDPQKIANPAWRNAATLFRQEKLAAARKALPPRMREEQQLIAMLERGTPHRAAVMALPKRLLRLYLSALQSWLFDQLLIQRLPQLGDLVTGDLAVKHVNGACFLVKDAALEQVRAETFEISPTAPLFGSKTKLADGLTGERERALLTTLGLRQADWKLGSGLTMTGDRRALRVPISAIATTQIGADLQLDFCLPRGSYATGVLSELLKHDRQIPPVRVAPESD